MDVAVLWTEYFQHKSLQQRNELVEYYLPLVRKVAAAMSLKLPAHLYREDIEGYGIIGLIEAVETFDQSRGVKFESYASLKIRAAIIDELRKQNFLPRSVWDKIKKVTTSEEMLMNTNIGEEVPAEKIAEQLGISVSDVLKIKTLMALKNHLSLDEMVDPESSLDRFSLLADDEKYSPENMYLQKVEFEELREAIKRLNEREQLILQLFYVEELSLKEIAAILDISVSRVSQIASKALEKLRKLLNEGVGV
ncbi:hypothetical protein cpu_10900 [Carboxydothermus pertinax]|uniref:FliA/WhiG family RNA polymerase sigma factor n=1 Tax=Carboxydothermus pertinax TaxID=870242 RepID=A0A1L8CUI6_9THEO|nr:hypothetical protein cpu_10900 [Carboxydothermus pertinax]